MIKETVRHKDFDGNEVTTTLYFNMTKIEVAENFHLEKRLAKIQEIFEGEPRDLTMPEVQELLDLVKLIMKLSYGVRSEDGQRFIKNEQVWEEFTQTMAYDAFLFSLFEDPVKGNAFMTGIIPDDLRQEVENTAVAPAMAQRPPTQDHQRKQVRPVQDVPLPGDQLVEVPQPASNEAQEAADEMEEFRQWKQRERTE